MNDSAVTPVDQAKNILAHTAASADPTASLHLAQAWALVAIADRLGELAQVTREVTRNPLAVNAAPFATGPTSAHPITVATTGFPTTPTIIGKKLHPVARLRATPQKPTTKN
ncbi:MAG: hypothetical protein H7248_02280 [Microbacteriaceae bacterium]|nr:hypothetical protein [Microbacteriaceae bacterium]